MKLFIPCTLAILVIILISIGPSSGRHWDDAIANSDIKEGDSGLVDTVKRGRGKKFDPSSRRKEITLFDGKRRRRPKSFKLGSSCSVFNFEKPQVDITKDKIYEESSFKQLGSEVWEGERTWSVSNDTHLEVIIILHSHCDPGWLKTFETYFQDDVKHILDNVVAKLTEDESLRFIWAEISYLSLWWDQANSTSRAQLKELVKSRRLEIVTGGWVMNDEAAAHIFAMTNQLIDGNEWVLHNLGVKPRYGWSIDPFGQSPTMAYLLRKMEFEAMVINRVHYSVKHYLSERRAMEFKWAFWRSPEDTILTHMLPFLVYDFPNTCGPDHSVCRRFNFIEGGYPVNETTVGDRADDIVAQFRKLSTIYPTSPNNSSTLMTLIGNDFAFSNPNDFDDVSKNWRLLSQYINEQDWNVKVRFGTLADYFDAANKEIVDLPTYAGDFFPYNDRWDQYWSGYYTSRPYLKRVDRTLEARLRSAEILFTLANLFCPKDAEIASLSQDLIAARHDLSLFQHHDGITGTSTQAVTQNYLKRMLNSTIKLQDVITRSAFKLVQPKCKMGGKLESGDDILQNEEIVVPRTLLLSEDSNTKNYLIAFNSLNQPLKDVLCIPVKANLQFTLYDQYGSQISDLQLNPILELSNPDLLTLELCFEADLAPLSLNVYQIELDGESRLMPNTQIEEHGIDSSETKSNPITTDQPSRDRRQIPIYGWGKLNNRATTQTVLCRDEYDRDCTPVPKFADPTATNQTIKYLTVDAGDLIVMINEQSGLVESIQSNQIGNENSQIKLKTMLMIYGTSRDSGDQSGSYLFIADKREPVPLRYNKPVIKIVRGPLMTRIETIAHDGEVPIRVRYTLTHASSTVKMEIESDVSKIKPYGRDMDLLVRFQTQINNNDLTFYHDLNGFQIQRQRFYEKIPVHGNTYPMASMAFIQDQRLRFTAISSHSHGVVSSQRGTLDIFLDRYFTMDDSRGIGEAMRDSRATISTFALMFEEVPFPQDARPSLTAHHETLKLNYPPLVMTSDDSLTPSRPQDLIFGNQGTPCDVHILNWRKSTFSEDYYALVLQRLAATCPSKCTRSLSETSFVNAVQLLSQRVIGQLKKEMTPSSLSLLHDKKRISLNDNIELPEPELASIKLHPRKPS